MVDHDCRQVFGFAYIFVFSLLVLSCSDEVPQDNSWDFDEDEHEWEPPELANENIDILWVVNNSGFLCGWAPDWQAGLSDFVDGLAASEVDFHIALTTTHMKEDDPQESGAKPGHFQSTPQPIPSLDPNCHHPKDEFAELIRDEFDPVVKAIERVVECTEEPEAWEHLWDPDEEELRCALDAEFFGCDGESRELSSFFPDPQEYREIPKVLRAEDYRDDSGGIDARRLRADLACAAMVGSRGSEFTKPLGAAVRALSPELTGGPGADPEEFPNAGFLRDDARLGVLFASNVNDCTHDGTLDEERVCGTAECTIQENLGEDGALVSIEDLRHDFLSNMAFSIGADIDGELSREQVDAVMAERVIAASFHGRYRREMELGLEDCTEDLEIMPSCIIGGRGRSWSGHRFSEFISTFKDFYPTPGGYWPGDEEEPDITDIPGAVCESLSVYMNEILGQ